jgi:uncharacterized protein YkwD
MVLAAVVAVGTVASAGVASVTRPADVDVTARRLDVSALASPPVDVSEVQATTELVNAERTKRGLKAMTWSDPVGQAAYNHSSDMARMGRMQHAGSDGSDAGDRLRAAGFSWSTWGETVGAGQPTPADIVQAWMDSPPHKEILLGSFKYVGVAKVVGSNGVPYWTLVTAS